MTDKAKAKPSARERICFQNGDRPKVSVALPVYNGEAFLEEAIESVLCQTYSDWELILCDNASDDATADICQKFARKDARIRYVRNESNIGAAKNFNRTVALARGQYFRWLAADSALHPKVLAKCVEVLQRDEDVVGVCTGFASIVEGRDDYPRIPGNFRFMDERVENRAKNLIDRVIGVRGPLTVWALMCVETLRKTGLIRPFIGSDSVFVLEFALCGKIEFIDEPLSLIRRHADSYSDMKNANDGVEGVREARWFDPESSGRFYLPHWRRLWEYLKVIARANSSFPAKIRMWGQVGILALRWRNRLTKEFWFALGMGKSYQSLRKSLGKASARERSATL